MDDQQLTYTQAIDDKTGEIKYVPNHPPEERGKSPDEQEERGEPLDTELRDEQVDEVREAVNLADFTNDEKLTNTLTTLMANNKRLRYDKRLEAGKLDNRRLVAYKNSKRLFKKKAIKDKNYQFTFLIDTSGSMLYSGDDASESRIKMALEATARTVHALEDIDIKSSIFSMNCSFREIKPFADTLDDEKFKRDITKAMAETYKQEDGSVITNMGGTSESVAYRETVEYLDRNSSLKTTNVVIIISDGEPGGGGRETQVIVDEKERLVENTGSDRTKELAQFWRKRPDILAFGLGIEQKARQVPTNRQVDDINKLPEVMGSLLTQLML